MKFAPTFKDKFNFMLKVILLTCFFGCSNILHGGKGIKLTNKPALPFNEPVVINPIPAHKDTVISHLTDIPKIAYIRSSEKRLIAQGVLPAYDTLLKHDFAVTKFAMRVADSARFRGYKLQKSNHKVDSLTTGERIISAKLDKLQKAQNETNSNQKIGRATVVLWDNTTEYAFWFIIAITTIRFLIEFIQAVVHHAKKRKPNTL